MDTLIKSINSINEWVGRTASWLTLILVGVVCFDVVTRYLFNDTAAWIMELEWHLFALIFLLGAGYAFKHDKHVRVDLFYSNFSKRDKAWVNLIGGIAFLVPWCIIVIIYSFDFGLDAYQMGEKSPDPGGLPARWVIKFAITIGMTLLLLQAIASILGAIQDIQNTEETS